MFTDSWIYRGFMRFDLWTKQHGGQGIDRRKIHSFVIYAEITLVWKLYCAVLICNVECRWKITLLFVYMLNLWLHMQPPLLSLISRCRTRNMMLPFDSRPIYRALTYIAVPFLGPQQPRYIGLTLYMGRSLLIFSDLTFKMAAWWPYWIFWFPG